MSHWYWHRHDYFAGLLTLAAVAVFMSMSGTASHQPLAGGPLSLGVWDMEATAPDKWATAGEQISPATPTIPQEPPKTADLADNPPLLPIPMPDDDEISPPQVSEVRVADVPTDAPVQTEQVAEGPAPATHEHTALLRHDAAPLTADDRPPMANPVEAAPRPVEQMSEAEIQAAVKDYERWLHRGDITVVLDYSLLDSSQIDQIAGLYVMQSAGSRLAGTRLAVLSNGKRLSVTDETFDKVLIGDLPLDRQRWPQCLQMNVPQFGPNAALTAKMIIKDEVALQLYRLLAERTGTVQPPPGTVCRIQLIPISERGIDVRLVSFSQLKEPRL